MFRWMSGMRFEAVGIKQFFSIRRRVVIYTYDAS